MTAMDIQELKNACNEKYAQAIEGMERGDANAEIARLLLDAAGLLVEISKIDFSRRAECEEKAVKLLSAAKKWRTGESAADIYRELTGRSLPAPTAPEPSPETNAPAEPEPAPEPSTVAKPVAASVTASGEGAEENADEPDPEKTQ